MRLMISVQGIWLARVAWLELHPKVLARALQPFLAPVRTLDALHLASVGFLREHGKEIALATCDERMASAAKAMGFPLYSL